MDSISSSSKRFVVSRGGLLVDVALLLYGPLRVEQTLRQME
jgi:hypothetical protein